MSRSSLSMVVAGAWLLVLVGGVSALTVADPTRVPWRACFLAWTGALAVPLVVIASLVLAGRWLGRPGGGQAADYEDEPEAYQSKAEFDLRTPGPDSPFLATYGLVQADHAPLFLGAGLLLAVSIVLIGVRPTNALAAGLAWASMMWGADGSFIAVGLAWRRSVPLSGDRAAIRAAVDRVCGRTRYLVLAESSDTIILGTPRARLRCQAVRIAFEDDRATLSAPALAFGQVRHEMERALAEPSCGDHAESRARS